jgi:hypothetical protein
VVLDMIFRGIVRVTGRELCVAVRDERLMRRVRVVALFIVLRSIAVMLRGQFMMVGRGMMMLRAREHFRHGFSDAGDGVAGSHPRRRERREIGQPYV